MYSANMLFEPKRRDNLKAVRAIEIVTRQSTPFLKKCGEIIDRWIEVSQSGYLDLNMKVAGIQYVWDCRGCVVLTALLSLSTEGSLLVSFGGQEQIRGINLHIYPDIAPEYICVGEEKEDWRRFVGKRCSDYRYHPLVATNDMVYAPWARVSVVPAYCDENADLVVRFIRFATEYSPSLPHFVGSCTFPRPRKSTCLIFGYCNWQQKTVGEIRIGTDNEACWELSPSCRVLAIPVTKRTEIFPVHFLDSAVFCALSSAISIRIESRVRVCAEKGCVLIVHPPDRVVTAENILEMGKKNNISDEIGRFLDSM